LLGTSYGGNGQSTFALPDLQGCAGLNFGQGNGLTDRFLGETGGDSIVTLTINQIPAHTHTAKARNGGGKADPGNNSFGTAGTQLPAPNFFVTTPGTPVNMNPLALSLTGQSLPHNNWMPYLVINFCIALQGIFPPRN
jgi:microcystin-dependent protein